MCGVNCTTQYWVPLIPMGREAAAWASAALTSRAPQNARKPRPGQRRRTVLPARSVRASLSLLAAGDALRASVGGSRDTAFAN